MQKYDSKMIDDRNEDLASLSFERENWIFQIQEIG